eukprot:COSAG02_NODE_161_length_32629_cov_10.363142_13_plen_79_part_00
MASHMDAVMAWTHLFQKSKCVKRAAVGSFVIKLGSLETHACSSALTSNLVPCRNCHSRYTGVQRREYLPWTTCDRCPA